MLYNIETIRNVAIYHGTVANFDPAKIEPASFFTRNIIGALGHVATNACATKIAEKEDVTDELIMNHWNDSYPAIISYRVASAALLRLNNSADNETWIKLCDAKIFLRHFAAAKDQREIIRNIRNMMKMYFLKNGDELDRLMHSAELFFDAIFKLLTCGIFSSDGDSVLFYLLSCIDYNSYLRQLGIISQDIDGFYNPRDQNAIIILNCNVLTYIDKYYIVPERYAKSPRRFILRFAWLQERSRIQPRKYRRKMISAIGELFQFKTGKFYAFEMYYRNDGEPQRYEFLRGIPTESFVTELINEELTCDLPEIAENIKKIAKESELHIAAKLPISLDKHIRAHIDVGDSDH